VNAGAWLLADCRLLLAFCAARPPGGVAGDTGDPLLGGRKGASFFI